MPHAAIIVLATLVSFGLGYVVGFLRGLRMGDLVAQRERLREELREREKVEAAAAAAAATATTATPPAAQEEERVQGTRRDVIALAEELSKKAMRARRFSCHNADCRGSLLPKHRCHDLNCEEHHGTCVKQGKHHTCNNIECNARRAS